MHTMTSAAATAWGNAAFIEFRNGDGTGELSSKGSFVSCALSARAGHLGRPSESLDEAR